MSSVEPKTAREPERYRVFLLKHISAQEGIQFLVDANIATVSQLNDANMLLVTAQQEVLIKAASLLTLVDSREKFAVKALLPACEANRMPSADVIAAEIRNTPAAVLRQQDAGVSIGTFLNPPGGTGHKAIIDVHGDELVAVAPASVMERIVAIAERVKPRPALGEVAQVEPQSAWGRPTPEELFGVARLDFNEPVEGSRSPEPNQAETTRPGSLISATAEAGPGVTSNGSTSPRILLSQDSSGGSSPSRAQSGDEQPPEPDSSRRRQEQVYAANKDAEPDKLFNELLGSLAEAEKNLAGGSAELAKVQTQGGLAEPFGSELRAELQAKEPNQAEPARAPQPAQPAAEPNAAPVPAKASGATGPDANAQPATNDEQRETQDERARRSYEPQTMPNADETLELTLPEKLDIISLLDLVGKYLNLNYVYTSQTLQGRPEINLKVQGPIKVRELYPHVESVLKFTGLAMTRKGNLVTIVPLETALDIDPALIQGERGEVQYGDVVVTRIFQLSYIDTTSARTLIEGMKVGAVTELPAVGTIIVTGYAYRMSRVEQLLEVIDKPGRPKQFRFRQLKYTMAKTLAPKVKQLVEQMGDI
ncbi:MAG: hypothetical protein MUO27_12290, partial [Sedimentisphaerales bacterium]|nr:hypothetical protein [Sedimentisphaerales bacterium]